MKPNAEHFPYWRYFIGGTSDIKELVVVTTRLNGGGVIQDVYSYSYNPINKNVGSLIIYTHRSSKSLAGNKEWNTFIKIYPVVAPTV
ncbi:hypothetical protein ACIP9G_01255 [Lysinibacillus sp. NPDC093197]|uniref:hypothetical protein n=1 Tax=Lysinibacillus sp. NPDC093197 TaxID=3364132 RepID=UPI00382F12A3